MSLDFSVEPNETLAIGTAHGWVQRVASEKAEDFHKSEVYDAVVVKISAKQRFSVFFVSSSSG